MTSLIHVNEVRKQVRASICLSAIVASVGVVCKTSLAQDTSLPVFASTPLKSQCFRVAYHDSAPIYPSELKGRPISEPLRPKQVPNMASLKALSGLASCTPCLASRRTVPQAVRRHRSQYVQRVSATTMAPQQTQVYGPANPAMRPPKILREDPGSGTVLGKLGGAPAVQVGRAGWSCRLRGPP